MAKVVFSSLLVCLWTTLRNNAGTDFHEIFRIGRVLYEEQSANLWNATFNPLSIGFLLLCFQENPCLLTTLREKGWTDLHEIFSKCRRWETEQSEKCSGVLRLTPWIQSRFFYFLDMCFLVILWKTDERIFMKFPRNVRFNLRKNHLDCFTPA